MPDLVIRCGCEPPTFEAERGLTMKVSEAKVWKSWWVAQHDRHKGTCAGGKRWRVVRLDEALAPRAGAK